MSRAIAKKTAAKKPSTKKTKPATPALPRGEDAHGVALVEAVIARIEKEGFKLLGGCGIRPPKKPQPVPPEVLRDLCFPDGSPLPPSLRRWLAFDAAWLGWFEDPKAPMFRPLKLDAYVRSEFDMEPFGYSDMAKRMIAGDCYGLHYGSDSRRFLYVGKADSLGEYPVLLLDTDDVPYVGVEYPGFDVYLGVHAGLVRELGDEYGSMQHDPRYKARIDEHASRNLWGRHSIEYGNDMTFDEDGVGLEWVHVPKGRKVPDGVVEIASPGPNPFRAYARRHEFR